MILTVDAGNSNIVLGVYNESQSIVAHWRLSTLPLRTDDELRVVLAGLFQDSSMKTSHITSIVIGCVVPPLLAPLVRAMKALFMAPVHVVTADSVPWLDISIDNRHEIGADLIANAVASRDYVSGMACAVFDFGTALSITVVDARGRILGASIAPGLMKASLALSEGTAQLPQIDLSAPPEPFGTNTITAIQSGIVFGYASLVEGMIRRYREHLRCDVVALATGGLADVIAPLVDEFEAVDQWLTLNGLRRIVERQP
ncbi:MAG: type III pantothenate kinase [Spirochaetota bacterium]